VKTCILNILFVFAWACSNTQNESTNKGEAKTDSLQGDRIYDSGSLVTSANVESKGLIPTSPECLGLDSSINDQIYFINGKSMRNAFPNLDSAWKRNDRVYFVSRDSLKFISLGTNYGGGKDEYQDADIGYVRGNLKDFIPEEIENSDFNPKSVRSPILPKFFFTASRFADFTTGWGIRLGMTESRFLQIMKGKHMSKKKMNSKLIYEYWNEKCLYKAVYTFKANRLVHFSFGYITP